MILDSLFQKISQKEIPSLGVGIDPNISLMNHDLQQLAKNDMYSALSEFCTTIITASAGRVGFVKFQSAYFEQFGMVGYQVLKEQMLSARNNGLVVMLDAKRGDIGSTSEAYAKAYLKPGADFECDILTVNGFLGLQTIQPFMQYSEQYDKSIIVLCKTSNPDSELIQSAKVEKSTSVSSMIAASINSYNEGVQSSTGFGRVGLVVGATHIQEIEELNSRTPNTYWLTPGLGYQNNKNQISNIRSQGVLYPMSRFITYPSQEYLSHHDSYTDSIIHKIDDAARMIHS